MRSIKIVVADDDEFWVEGLRALSGDDNEIEVVGTTVSLKDLEKLIETTTPDVAVLDIAWPGDKVAGIKMITQLQEKFDVKVVAITAYPELVEFAEAAGAFTLKKGFKLNQLIDMIWLATQDKGEARAWSLPIDITEQITERELEVLGEVARGSTDKEIASKLHISEGTVKKHVSSILGKLQANNRAHAAVLAYRKNLI